MTLLEGAKLAIRQEAKAEEKRESAKHLIKRGKLTCEEIAEALSEVQKIAGVKTA